MLLLSSAVVFLAASVALSAAVVWLDLSSPTPVPYTDTALRAVVIGGFFLFLGWLMWCIGRSLTADNSHHGER